MSGGKDPAPRPDPERRASVLASIRRSLGVTGQENPRRAAVDGRLAAAPRGVVPQRGQLDVDGRTDLFRRMAEAAAATVTIVASPEAVPAELARVLRDGNMPATLRMGEDPRLAAMPWHTTSLDIAKGASDGDDVNAVSYAFGAVAESGSLALVSGPDNPTTLNFLPDTHLVVVTASDIAGDYETIFDRVRAMAGRGRMPRTVNFVTGPSRSADIEQKLILGAHGPRRLHIVIVKPETASASSSSSL